MVGRKTAHSSLPLPSGQRRRVRWRRLYACAQAEAVVRAVEDHQVPALLIAPDMTAARRLKTELDFFAQEHTEVFLLPDWETLPYDLFSPREEISAQRIETLRRLPQLRSGIGVAALETVLQYVVPPAFIRDNTFSLKVGETLDFEGFRRKLSNHGYTQATQVTTYGEYAVRGAVIDFYPPKSPSNQGASGGLPVRIDLLDEHIESLRLFDPEQQTSVRRIDSVLIQPVREFALDDTSISEFRRRFRIEMDDIDTRLYRDVSEGIIPGGIEYYLPLFFDQLATLFDYMPDNSVIFSFDGLSERVAEYWELITQRHEQAQLDRDRPLLAPARLFLSESMLRKQLQRFSEVQIESFEDITGTARDGGTRLLPTLFMQSHVKQPLANFGNFLNGFDGRVLITARSAGYQEQLTEMLKQADLRVHAVSDWQAFCASDAALCLCLGDIETGVRFERTRLALVSDGQILGRKSDPTRRNARRTPDADAVIYQLSDLTPDCPIVHEQHGVGRYRGLEHLEVGGTPFEFLVMEYAGDDKLYVPIASLHLVTRYTGGDSETAPWHKLGEERWNKAKRKAAQKAFDVAAELLDTQARREAASGIACEISEADDREFAAQFPYEETPDQITAMQAIHDDLRARRAMDRIVCGDVGFGKTEIAMRTAFNVVYNHYQVAVLAPTTLLASQHFESFSSRFAEWPVKVEMLSRFVTRGQQQRIIQGLAAGTVDIVIGTHQLLTQNIPYKRLGLIVIDEEQRFGVRHKERLKSQTAGSNVLTLTATPIPRTLNMSLSGLRDLSLITTPPPGRRAIKTFVNEWSDALISEICQRELHRGGQVYFVHNRVEDIEGMTEYLRELLPAMEIRFAHGQMRERELEGVMLDFYRHRFDMLVCTTIIESGIDVPTANSIIINRADCFGLAQLHQLRGRVGRSHYQAYAYLALDRPRSKLPSDARKRLEAIESLEELGTGFTLAAHDLEIRGAGELLGEGQSGHIHEVGFAMYNRLLKHAVKMLRSGQVPDADKPLDVVTEVNLGQPALIPEDYIPDVNLRLVLYRRISSAQDAEALAELKREMIDRFGSLPEHASNLFINADLRLQCRALGIRKLEISASGGRLDFDSQPQVDIERLVSLVRDEPKTYQLGGGNTLLFQAPEEECEQRHQSVQALLTRIGCREAA